MSAAGDATDVAAEFADARVRFVSAFFAREQGQIERVRTELQRRGWLITVLPDDDEGWFVDGETMIRFGDRVAVSIEMEAVAERLRVDYVGDEVALPPAMRHQ